MKVNNGRFVKGHFMSDKIRQKIGNTLKGHKTSEITKRKIGLANKGKTSWIRGKHHSETTRRKISESQKGHRWSPDSGFKKGHKSGMTGRKHTKESIYLMRERRINYIKEKCNGICPRIGKHEKQILDDLEQESNIKIIRQFEIEGYFIDGYIPELNLAVEVDERPKNQQKDIERERIIKEKLNCKFMRIKDYD